MPAVRCPFSSVASFAKCSAAALLAFGVAVGAQMPSAPKPPTTTLPTINVPPGVQGAQQTAEQAKQASDEVKKATGKDKPKQEEEKKKDEALKPGSVGITLSRLMDQVNVTLTSASAAGNWAAMEAGRDVAIAISNTQNVYEDDLNKDINGKINPNVKTSVDQLQSAIDQLNKLTKASLQIAATGAEQVSNELPYRPQEPKLIGFTPRFLVPSKDTYVAKVHFTGKFDYAAKPEFFPSLVIHGFVYKPVKSTTTDIEFGVPITDIFPAKSPTKQLGFVIATIKMPWEITSMMGKRHKKEEDDFRVFMLALPSGPGTVKYMAKATKLEAGKAQQHISAPYHQCSGRCGADDQNHLWTETPDAGCSVVKGSSVFNVTASSGAFKKEFLGDGGEGASYSVTTTRAGGGNQSVDFTINFQETCSKEVPNDVGDEVQMPWGASHKIEAKDGQWKVSLDAFDGTHADFVKADTSNPFLKITTNPEGGVTLTTPDPATLVWPASSAQ